MRKGTSAPVLIAVRVRGTVSMRSGLRLHFDYGALPPWSEDQGSDQVAKIGPVLVTLRASVALDVAAQPTSAEFDMTAILQLHRGEGRL